MTTRDNSPAIRPPAVAGRFFPAQPDELRTLVDDCLAHGVSSGHSQAPKAIIAPHAGFVFSGPVAGSAFATLTAASETIRKVILIGPSHHVPFDGVATSAYDLFSTPLGEVRVDRQGRRRALEFDFVHEYELAHQHEHSLETHLPFLQQVLGDFQIVPLVTGRVPREDLADLLRELWGGPETLICVSSDLSHFHDYDDATRRDRITAQQITSFRPGAVGARDACGYVAIRGLLNCGSEHGMRSELIDLRNSGDTKGDRDRVVGYGAFAFWE